MKDCPRTLRVGPLLYRISWEQGEEFDQDGECDPDAETIRIRSGMTLANTLITLKHEIIHALNDLYGLEDSSSEEDFASRQSRAWVDFEINNPQFCKWYSSKISKLSTN